MGEGPHRRDGRYTVHAAAPRGARFRGRPCRPSRPRGGRGGAAEPRSFRPALSEGGGLRLAVNKSAGPHHPPAVQARQRRPARHRRRQRHRPDPHPGHRQEGRRHAAHRLGRGRQLADDRRRWCRPNLLGAARARTSVLLPEVEDRRASTTTARSRCPARCPTSPTAEQAAAARQRATATEGAQLPRGRRRAAGHAAGALRRGLQSATNRAGRELRLHRRHVSFFGSNVGQVSPFEHRRATDASAPTSAIHGPAPAVTLFGRGVVGNTAFDYFVTALRQNNLLRILAEPNLVAISGQEASFLAGGEFPIPVAAGRRRRRRRRSRSSTASSACG